MVNRYLSEKSFVMPVLFFAVLLPGLSGFDSANGSEIQTKQSQTLVVLETWHGTPVISATRTATPTATPTPTLKPPLEDIDDWHYQLQNLSLPTLRDCAYDLLVMDYSSTGDEDGEYSESQIKELSTVSNPKTVLAYMSIGEAENYRFYWQSQWKPGTPEFLDEANPDFPDNYAVRFWMQDWKDIIADNPTSYLSRILVGGFDGVYLDKLDVYEFFEEKLQDDPVFRAQFSDRDFRAEMVAFVAHIAQLARNQRPGFLVVGQNAVPLWNEAGYRDLVDGVACEELYFIDPGDRRPSEETKELEGYLRLFRKTGRLVLTVDYLDYSQQQQPSFVLRVAEAYQRSSTPENDFVPFVTNVDLDTFRVNPGHEPD